MLQLPSFTHATNIDQLYVLQLTSIESNNNLEDLDPRAMSYTKLTNIQTYELKYSTDPLPIQVSEPVSSIVCLSLDRSRREVTI